MSAPIRKLAGIAAMIGLALLASSLFNSGRAQGVSERTLAQCGAIADPAQRLACYDRLQPPSPSAAPSGDATHWPEFTARPSPMRPPQANHPAPSSSSRALITGVAQYALSPNGRFTVTLDNGQIWRQLDSDDGKALFRKGRNLVQISRGFWGSYDLRLNGVNTVFKVVRVK